MSEVQRKATLAHAAAPHLAITPNAIKSAFLNRLADLLDENHPVILAANAEDLRQNPQLTTALIDRLTLTHKRIDAMAGAVRELAQLPDPVGQVLRDFTRPNGLHIRKVSVPMGVIAMIYEARPNVTIDAAALALKAGSAVILRGGKEALNANKILATLLRQAALESSLNPDLIQLIEDPDKNLALELMKANGLVDLLIPRGSARLIDIVKANATVPILETGVGNCHAYVETSADLDMALSVILNAKCSRPSVCNALEKVLVDEAIADAFIPKLSRALREAGVEVRGDQWCCDVDESIRLATETDWDTEYLDLILAIKVVKDLDDALAHIAKHGTHHSETILTQDDSKAVRFLNEVDAAAVYHNASTRFTDGGEFGMSAEIGISTQKMHARGPVGLDELCSTKYLIAGNGQIR
jgi:glutamate-5-semialdehyde dehydrogenase